MDIKGFTLDTNIVSAYLKGDKWVRLEIERATRAGFDLKINGIAYYEVRRGFENLQSQKKLDELEQMYKEFGILLIEMREIY